MLGLGGLGSLVAVGLAAAGVGRLGLIDDLPVRDADGLHSPVYTAADLGKDRASAVKEAIEARFSSVSVDARETGIRNRCADGGRYRRRKFRRVLRRFWQLALSLQTQSRLQGFADSLDDMRGGGFRRDRRARRCGRARQPAISATRCVRWPWPAIPKRISISSNSWTAAERTTGTSVRAWHFRQNRWQVLPFKRLKSLMGSIPAERLTAQYSWWISCGPGCGETVLRNPGLSRMLPLQSRRTVREPNEREFWSVVQRPKVSDRVGIIRDLSQINRAATEPAPPVIDRAILPFHLEEPALKIDGGGRGLTKADAMASCGGSVRARPRLTARPESRQAFCLGLYAHRTPSAQRIVFFIRTDSTLARTFHISGGGMTTSCPGLLLSI